MKKTLRGIIHVHSHYSYDGKNTLSEIAEAARNNGFDFVCIAEHSNNLDREKVALLVKECDNISSLEFLMIPGIEFSCQDELHLLGIGLRKYDSAIDPLYLNKFIQQNGGISVIAHPTRKTYSIPSALLSNVNGIEVWNCVYDGRFFPNTDALVFYSSAKLRNPRLVSFCGADLHRISNNINKTFVCLDTCRLEEQEILCCLREGRFTMKSNWCNIPACPGDGPLQRLRLKIQRNAYLKVKQIRDFLIFL